MNATTEISVVIPAFDEEHRLPDTLRRLSAWAEASTHRGIELIVVDDGSSDRTPDVVREFAMADRRVRLCRSDVNLGKGAALRRGFLEATGALVVFLDADLPVSPETVDGLVDSMNDVDVLLGTRRDPSFAFRRPQPRLRRLGGWLFIQVVSALGLNVASDPQCGVKVLRRDVAERVIRSCMLERFAFDVEMIARAHRAGLRVGECPVDWTHVEGSTLRPVADALVTIRDLVLLKRSLVVEGRRLAASG